MEIDIDSLLRLENNCNGCVPGQKCCCSSYDVCITTAEMKRIIKYLPEAAKYCPHLLAVGGYDNVFDPEEPGLYSIDGNEDGLCLLAYWRDGRTHCSLHTVALDLGLPLEDIKPKCCMLWPMHFSDGEEVVGMIEDAFDFSCNRRKPPDARTLSPGFIDTIEQVYGEGCGAQVQEAAEKGERRTLLITRR